MDWPYLVICVVFVPVFALAFTIVTYLLGGVMPYFRPQGGSLGAVYKGFLFIAAIYMLVGVLRLGVLPALVVMAVAYRYVFDATWVHALVIGLLGGIVGIFGLVGISAIVQYLGYAV